jgi:hypothetical protein
MLASVNEGVLQKDSGGRLEWSLLARLEEAMRIEATASFRPQRLITYHAHVSSSCSSMQIATSAEHSELENADRLPDCN